MQAAPAVRVAQLVRQHQLAAVERERIETELRVARTIQQTLLPKEVPAIEGGRSPRSGSRRARSAATSMISCRLTTAGLA